ncbi:MAG: metallophosphatase [Bacteroidota bacterium]
MHRRRFLNNSLAATTLVGCGGMTFNACQRNTKKKLTILHTNDVHSHIDPFPSTHNRYSNQGGVARRAALVAQIRKENPNTLLFDAGDIFQGTPYFNFYGGELEFKLMSMLKYDAATIGNHDFDNGITGLLAQMPHAQFSFLSANYDFSKTVMNGLVDPYKIFIVNDLRIGVYGLGIKLQGLVNKKLYKETVYLHPYEIAQDMERNLHENEHCDVVICLSHMGYEYQNKDIPSDLGLAAVTRHTDLIIGGHTHTFLEKPTLVQNAFDKTVLVNQVGCYGINLGRVDFHFDSDKKAVGDGISIAV